MAGASSGHSPDGALSKSHHRSPVSANRPHPIPIQRTGSNGTQRGRGGEGRGGEGGRLKRENGKVFGGGGGGLLSLNLLT